MERDILLREELEGTERESSQFSLWYTLDRPDEGTTSHKHRKSKFFLSISVGWKYSSGYISADMISEHLPPPGANTQILMCGPPPMIKFACLPNLEKLGYTEDMYVAF